jgi:serine/threonine-protein kinase
MTQSVSNEVVGNERIDSWKSIAQYLGRSSRTVQRWHFTYGLPIHRLGGDSGSVFAYTDELDSWLRRRDPALSRATNAAAKPVLIYPAQPQADADLLPTVPVIALTADSEKSHAAGLVNSANKLWSSFSAQNLKIIARHFREAIDLYPDNAKAFAGLSYALLSGGVLGYLRIPTAYVSAKDAMSRAKALDPELSEVRCTESWLKMVLDRKWLEAREGFDSLLAKPKPAVSAIIGSALLYIAEGDPQQAAVQLYLAVQRSVLNTAAVALHCWSKYLAGEYTEVQNLIEDTRASGQCSPLLDAVEALAGVQCEKQDTCIPRIEALAAESQPYQLVYGVLGYAYAIGGNTQKANEVLDAISRSDWDRGNAAPYAMALILVGLGENHDAVRWIEQSYRSGSLWSLGFPVDPILMTLRDEPSYRALMGKISYPSKRNPATFKNVSSLERGMDVPVAGV